MVPCSSWSFGAARGTEHGSPLTNVSTSTPGTTKIQVSGCTSRDMRKIIGGSSLAESSHMAGLYRTLVPPAGKTVLLRFRYLAPRLGWQEMRKMLDGYVIL